MRLDFNDVKNIKCDTFLFRFVSAVGSPVVNISAPSTPTFASSQSSGARYSERSNKGDNSVRSFYRLF